MDAEAQLAGFLEKFEPQIANTGRDAIAWIRKRLPGATVLVYDNYNALAMGFGPSERASEIVGSIAVYPKRVALFLSRGASLPDPHKIFEGAGNKVRNITLPDAARLDHPHVAEALEAALALEPIADRPPGRLVIKSISAKQRPRRPG